MTTPTLPKEFYEIYEALPRQGPGDRASTERALRFLPPLTPQHRILDVGCGSGAQTLDLARATPARIVAVDAHAPFVARLVERAAALGLGERIEAQVGDMGDLRFADGSFDVVWSEGAIFIIGFSKGLAEWRRLITPGGHLVVSEFCWFRDDPPDELLEMFRGEVPADASVDDRRRAVVENGYELVGDFRLPAAVWWDSYCVPLAEQLVRFRAAHAGDAGALAVAAGCEREIELYEKHSEYFGYVFFVMKRRAV
jgi:SAM-dependent methyltransferase